MSGRADVRSAKSVTPFFRVSSRRYISCVRRNSASHVIGGRTLQSARSRRFCACSSDGSVIVSWRSSASLRIRYSLLSFCVISGKKETGSHGKVVLPRILRIARRYLRLEIIGIFTLCGNGFQIFKICNFRFRVLKIFRRIM